MIRLSVPGTLLYRDIVLRVVASACRLVKPLTAKQEASREVADFSDKFVSAVGEAFNNVALHAYRGRAAGHVEMELEVEGDRLTVRLIDTGTGFDPTEEHPPDLRSLPESHMGLYIIRSCVDDVSYRRGNPPLVPNVLTLTKRRVTAPSAEVGS
ncbi:MAG TPA: ATP-binding protein [Polyangiaceae bacterium]